MPIVFLACAGHIAVVNYLYPMTDEDRQRLEQLHRGYGLKPGQRLPNNMTKAPLVMDERSPHPNFSGELAKDDDDSGFIDLSHLHEQISEADPSAKDVNEQPLGDFQTRQ